MFGLLMFVAGFLLGVSLTSAVFIYWPSGPAGKHIRSEYPRKTTMPREGKRPRGRPTNINEPPSEVRQALFRGRREVKE